jgi:hypothetical protein
MTDNTELQRLTRLRRLGRQIAASLPADLAREQAFHVHKNVPELPAKGPRHVRTPASTQGGASERSCPEC